MAVNFILKLEYKIVVANWNYMGFSDFGHNSSKQNRALRQDKQPFQRMKENYFLTPQPVNFKLACPKKVKEIKLRHLKQKRQESIVDIVLLVLSTSLVGWLFLYVLGVI